MLQSIGKKIINLKGLSKGKQTGRCERPSAKCSQKDSATSKSESMHKALKKAEPNTTSNVSFGLNKGKTTLKRKKKYNKGDQS